MTVRWLPDCSVEVKMVWIKWAHTGCVWMYRPFNSVRNVKGTCDTGVTGLIVNTFGYSNPPRRLSVVA